MSQFDEKDVQVISSDPSAHALDDIRIRCNAIIENLKNTYGWPDNNVRVQLFHELRNVNQSSLAIYIFQRSIFPSENFWRAYFQNIPSSSDFDNHYRELDVMGRFGCFYGQFSIYESNVRNLVRLVDPAACNSGNSTFDGVVRWLLSRVTVSPSLTEFVELIRLTRNTIHNNGVYRPERGGDRDLVFNGSTYEFRNC